MKNTEKLYEYRLDRWDEGTEILKFYKKYFVGVYPHLVSQLIKRCKKFDYKLLKLPLTQEELLDDVWNACDATFSTLADMNIDKQSLKGLYTQVRPVNVVDKRGKLKATVNVELTVMFNASHAGFTDAKLFDEIWRMRKGHVNRDKRNKFLKDHSIKPWLNYLYSGKLSEGMVGVFLESAVVVVSDESTYPVSWTHRKTDVPRNEIFYPEVDMLLEDFQKMWYKIQNDESNSQVKSLLSPTTMLKLGIKTK